MAEPTKKAAQKEEGLFSWGAMDKVKSWVEEKVQQAKEAWQGDEAKQKTAQKSGPKKPEVVRLDGKRHMENLKTLRNDIKNVQPTVQTKAGRQSDDQNVQVNKEGVAEYRWDQLQKQATAKKKKSASRSLPDVKAVPRLDIGEEPHIRASDFLVKKDALPNFDTQLVPRLRAKKHWGPEQDKMVQDLGARQVGTLQKFAAPELKKAPKVLVTQSDVDRVVIKEHAEPALALKDVRHLTADELDMLTALILYQKGDKDDCAAAVALFHHLSAKQEFQAEAWYHTAQCSKKLGFTSDYYDFVEKTLKTQDPHYTPAIIESLGVTVAYEHLKFIGQALAQAVQNPKLNILENEKTKDNAAHILAAYYIKENKPELALKYARAVSEKHPKKYRARYIEALAHYSSGAGRKSVEIQQALLKTLNDSKLDQEFETLAAANLARMQFQAGMFESAQKNFLRVHKGHPLWLQSLIEMGWSQLQAGDFAGAIGNMYSVHSPFFNNVYKPESYVIRTIGYLKLCQYGDAYRSLTLLEKQYRPWLQQMEQYTSKHKRAAVYYQTVKNMLRSDGKQDVDGLPPQVIREMARHRDFINIQKALNRNIDERRKYDSLTAILAKAVRSYERKSEQTRSRIAQLKAEYERESKAQLKQRKPEVIAAEINSEQERLKNQLFLLRANKRTGRYLNQYVSTRNSSMDRRIARLKSEVETTLAKRLYKMKDTLANLLENNEFLRYEVFSGSGENIRFQVTGGEKDKRVPASVIPKTKELRWAFEGEYWADEIGHYRSSLKSNCPNQAVSLGG